VPEFGCHTNIEVCVANSMARAIIDDMLDVRGTGSASDGKIIVYSFVEAYDIGSKEKGDTAL